MPFSAHFGFVVFMDNVSLNKFVVAMSICALLVELAVSKLLPVSTYFCLVVHPEVFNIPQHFIPRLKVHLLFRALTILRVIT